MLSKVDKNR